MRLKSLRTTLTGIALGFACGVAVATLPSTAAADPTTAAIQRIVRIYADEAVRSGASVGVEIGVIYGNEPAQFVSAGDAVLGLHGRRPFTPDTIFQLGSVTKVFTTNLLGQAIVAGTVGLQTPLSSFAGEIETLQPLTGEVTIEELADFTGGFPSLGGFCGSPPAPGCLPSARPTITQYTAQDFAEYFQSAVPMNFFVTPPAPVNSLPAPYNYSDFSIGLLGLLLGNSPGAALTNAALTGWFNQVDAQILKPLRMNRTYLFGARGPLVASGYESALARATVANGRVAAIDLVSPGGLYAAAPHVRIVGGGGHGATAQATIDSSGRVNSIAVVKPGNGYYEPATVTFNGGGSTVIAKAGIIVRGGKVVAVEVTGTGQGYQRVPVVTISGGHAANGRDAQAVAEIANGRLSYVRVTDGGAGYAPPLAVVMAPGGAVDNTIPIWAPAGALSSSMRNMTKFAAAALGHPRIDGVNAPLAISQGFAIAEQPYACAAADPSLADCPAGAAQSALAWAITPPDPDYGVGEVIAKNGGLNGFSTQVMLMPSRDLAVVAFANTRQNIPDLGQGTAEAAQLARNVMFALFYGLP